jgi:dynein heavy chain
MYSAEQEEVAFRKDIYPIGNVEDWMCEIERVMRETLRQVIRDALEDYTEVSRLNNSLIRNIFLLLATT